MKSEEFKQTLQSIQFYHYLQQKSFLKSIVYIYESQKPKLNICKSIFGCSVSIDESTKFEFDFYNNKFGFMINQEEYLHNQPPSHELKYFVDNLLQQDNIEDQLFPQQQSQTIKQQIEQQAVDSYSQANSPLSYNILEKQQCHSFPPERFFEYVGDQALENEDESDQESLLEEPVPIKKPQKINKLSYLEETRAIKIQRYKSKKTRRIWNRKISYDCRKIVADNRERVNGRFVKKSPINVGSQSLHNSNCRSKDLQVLKQFIEPDGTFYDFNI